MMKMILVAFISLLVVQDGRAQQGTFSGRLSGQILGGGEDRPHKLAMERQLLDRKRKNAVAWKHFPLTSFPPRHQRSRRGESVQLSDEIYAKRRVTYVTRFLKDRKFEDYATVKSIDEKDGSYTVKAWEGDGTQEERRAWSDVSLRYITIAPRRGRCEWTATDKPSYAVGDRLLIQGVIQDADQDDDLTNLTLGDVSTELENP